MNINGLWTLLKKWEEAYHQGQDLTPAELGVACGEIADELQVAIEALRRMMIRTKRWENSCREISERSEESPFTVSTTKCEVPLVSSLSSESSLVGPLDKGSPPLPKNIPGYEVYEELGRGGMGIVYRARQIHLNRVVALKMILSGELAGAEERLRFMEEAKAIAALKHPGIIEVFDFGMYEGNPYFSLEYCEAGSLGERISGTPFTPKESAQIIEYVAQAMHAAHEHNIIHRDLKPANILIGKDGKPRVTDFGLARRVESGRGLTMTGAVMGSPSYMAPEQAQGKKAIGAGVDVYALGAILYECLTGRPPFRAATTYDTLAQVISDEPVPPRQLNPQISRDLETICLKCLDKVPVRRYAHAQELADDLRRWLANEPILARPVSKVERIVRWCQKRPMIASLSALLVLLTLGSLLVISALYSDAAEQARIAKSERDIALDAEDRAKIAKAEAEQQRDTAERRNEASQYAYLLTQAQRNIEDGNLEQAVDNLNQTPSRIRGGEFYHTRILLCNRLKEQTIEKMQFRVWLGENGRQLITTTMAHLCVWNTATQAELKRKKIDLAWGSRICVHSKTKWVGIATGLDVDDDSLKIRTREMEIPQGNSEITLLSLNDEKQKKRIRTSNPVLALRFTSDALLLVCAERNGVVSVWEIATAKKLQEFKMPIQQEACLAIHPEGQMIACASEKVVYLADRTTGKMIHALTGHKGTIVSVAFSGDGKYLASADYEEGLIYIWDTRTGVQVRHYGSKGIGKAACVTFSSGRNAILGYGITDPGFYTVVDVESGKVLSKKRSDLFGSESVSINHDATQWAFSTTQGIKCELLKNPHSILMSSDQPSPLLKQFTQQEQRIRASMQLQRSAVTLQPLSKDKDVVQNYNLVLRGAELPILKYQLNHLQENVPATVTTALGEIQLLRQRNAIILRRLKDRIEHHIYHSMLDSDCKVALSPDGLRLATVGSDHLKLWDTQTGTEVAAIRNKDQSKETIVTARGMTIRNWIDQIGFDRHSKFLVLVHRDHVTLLSLAQNNSPKLEEGQFLIQYLMTREKEVSFPWIDKLVAGNSHNMWLRVERGHAHLALNRITEAITDFAYIVEHSPSPNDLLPLPLMQLEAQGIPASICIGLPTKESTQRNSERVWRLLRNVMPAKLDTWALRVLQGYILVRTGEVKPGMALLYSAARERKNRPDLWALIITIEIQNENLFGANKAYEELVRLVSNKAIVKWHNEHNKRSDAENVWHQYCLTMMKTKQQVVQHRQPPNLYSLVVGIDDYSRVNRVNNQTLRNLNCSIKDGRAIQQLLASQKGSIFRTTRITELYDAKATSKAILSTIQEIGSQATKADLAVIYLNTHGVVNRSEQTNEILSNGTLIVSDYEPKDISTQLTKKQLLSAISQIRCPILLIVDSCHGGIFTTDIPRDLASRLYVVASCQANQPALEPSPRTGMQNGLFVQCFAKAVNSSTCDLNRDGLLDLDELQLCIRFYMPTVLERLKQDGTIQIPVTFPSVLPRIPLFKVPIEKSLSPVPPKKDSN